MHVLAPAFNIKGFVWLYGFAHQYVFLDFVGIFFAQYVAYVLGGILCVLLVYPKVERVKRSAMVLTAVFSAVVAVYVVKPLIVIFYAEPRPFMLLLKVQPLITPPSGENLQSFPSSHALFFFAIAMVVFLFYKRWGIFFFVSALLMGIARIFVGVHWPLDIVAGAALGCLIGWLSYRLYLHYQEVIDAWVGVVHKKLSDVTLFR